MSEEQIVIKTTESKAKSNRGRKPKYVDENARKMAKREQNRTYRERKRNELIALRRLAAERLSATRDSFGIREVAKNNNSSDENNSETSEAA